MKMSLFEYDAIHKGMKQGIEQGKELGMELRDIQHVKSLIQKGFSKEEIANLLDLSLDSVQKYIDQSEPVDQIPI